jgi:two-component system cell cycle sensor histidine kinase/response regulator CckA
LPYPYVANLTYALWVPLLALLLSREYAHRGERVSSSEQKFKAIFDHTFQFTGLLTPDGTLLEANRTALSFAELRREDVVGLPFWKTPWWTHAPDQQQRLRQAITDAAGGKTIRFEVTNAGADGRIAYVDFSIKPVRDEHGTVILLIPEGRDISERKQAESALTMSEARYRTLIESAPEAIVLLDMQEGCFADANQKACELFGLSMAELRTLGPIDVSPAYQPDGRSSRDAAEGYLQQAIGGGRPVFEWTHRTRGGRETPCEVRLVRLPDPSRTLIRGSIADITERKRAERALHDIQSRHSAILESSLDGLVVIDASSRILEFNSVAETIFGYDRKDAVGKDLAELLIPPPLREAHYRGVQRYLSMRPVVVIGRRLEMPALRADGTEVRVELSIQPIVGVEPVLFAGVVRDITERLRLEEQLRQSQKMEAVGQLAGGVAHDFNNLLTVIAGYCELLLTQLAGHESLYNQVRGIAEAGERAASLTQRLLAFSRQAVLAPKVVNINAVVGDTERMLRRLIGEDILLDVSLDRQARPVRIDPGHMSQVVMNLALNARDALPKGGALTIETGNIELDGQPSGMVADVPAGSYVQLIVRDNGCGISQEIKDRIFEPFFTTKGVGKGTGLGLAVVHGIVKQSGGYITVESEVGKGATFTIYLPAAVELPVEPQRIEADGSTRGIETVLLVEDEDAVRGLEELALKRHGFNVLSAADGAEALRLAREHHGRIDLLATDVVMPNMSGRDLADTLRSECADLKVLFLSGYTDDTLLRHGVFGGHEAFLQKPFALAAFARKVREVLDRK